MYWLGLDCGNVGESHPVESVMSARYLHSVTCSRLAVSIIVNHGPVLSSHESMKVEHLDRRDFERVDRVSIPWEV